MLLARGSTLLDKSIDYKSARSQSEYQEYHKINGRPGKEEVKFLMRDAKENLAELRHISTGDSGAFSILQTNTRPL